MFAKRKILLFALIGVVCSGAVRADLYDGNIEKFRQYNPDGKKYEFVRSYIIGLRYLRLNSHRAEKFAREEKGDYKDSSFVKAYIDRLKMDNVNLRVARNLLKKYLTPENGLILQVADLFTNACDEQISLNNEERKMFEELYDSHVSGLFGDFDGEKFLKDQVPLNSQRKESLKKLLEASLLVGKVLISDREDRFGELSYLGVTEKERRKLLDKLDEFYGDDFEGTLREGQTFLQGSISAIRETLEDSSFSPIDG